MKVTRSVRLHTLGAQTVLVHYKCDAFVVFSLLKFRCFESITFDNSVINYYYLPLTQEIFGLAVTKVDLSSVSRLFCLWIGASEWAMTSKSAHLNVL